MNRLGTSGYFLTTSWRENKLILKFSEPVYLGSIFTGLMGKGYVEQFITSDDFPGDTVKGSFISTQRIVIDKQNVTSIEINNSISETALPFWDNINFIPMSEFSDSKTYVPDDVFEQALIDKGLDDVIDDSVKTSTILYETNLSLNGAQDLTVIENFYSLVYLYVYTSPDLSGYLELNSSPQLRVVSINESSLDEVNFSHNDKLQYISLPNSQISKVTLPLYSDLLRLDLSNNQLTSLDLSPYDSLIQLALDTNQLNQLIIDNGANNLLSDFSTLGNLSLLCIQTSEVNYANANFTSINPEATFEEEFDFTTSTIDYLNRHEMKIESHEKFDAQGRYQPNSKRRQHLFKREIFSN